MNLNADIIYKELSKSVRLDSYGTREKKLLLPRPVFWIGEGEMEEDRLYIVQYGQFPQYTQTARGDLIVCVGGNLPDGWNDELCTVFVVNNVDILLVFNLLQEIFEHYDAWEKTMQEIVDEGGDMQQLVACCDQMIDAPVMIVDKEFHCLASNVYLYDDPRFSDIQPENNLTNSYSLSLYLEQYGTNNAIRRGLFMAEIKGLRYLSKNIFDHDSLVGSMSAFLLPDHEMEPTIKLSEFFFTYAEKLFRKTIMRSISYTHALRSVLSDLINCCPVDSLQVKKLQSGLQDAYICAKLQLDARLKNITADYCCAGLEETLPGCVAFEHETAIIAFLNVTKMGCSPEDAVEQIFHRLPRSDIKIGVSNSFEDITNARFYFREASVALDIGKTFCDDNTVFLFDDCIFAYILMKSVGEFKMEFLINEYLGPLREHDANSPVSYLETLRSYIDNNLNILKTSKELFLHRSTLSTRLDKIRQIIKLDWNKPDDRLILSILLKGQEYCSFKQNT